MLQHCVSRWNVYIYIYIYCKKKKDTRTFQCQVQNESVRVSDHSLLALHVFGSVTEAGSSALMFLSQEQRGHPATPILLITAHKSSP